MLSNYFKLAIKVLGRQKFFTFISLFGISFTLMFLMLFTAFTETELGSHQPLTNKDKMVFLPSLKLMKVRKDTIFNIDSSMVNNMLTYDTTITFKDRLTSSSQSEPSLHFLKNYMTEIDDVENYSFFNPRVSFDFFLNSKKVKFEGVMTDANFWNIFNFIFVEGKAYSQSALDQQEQVIILTQKASLKYFGMNKGVLGEEVTLEGKTYKVIGVVEDPISKNISVIADVYIPYTNLPSKRLSDTNFFGGFEAVFLAKDKSSVKKIQADIDHLSETFKEVPSYDGIVFNKIELINASFLEFYATNIYNENGDVKENLKTISRAVGFLLFLFIILPILNLVNLNVSRIMERSAEIGVRKAFGAHSGNILFQFVFENVILTLIGGIIGLLLAVVLIYLINSSQVLPNTVLQFNYKVFLYSLLICLGFGILSGLLPAYKMSKVHIVNALKQNQR